MIIQTKDLIIREKPTIETFNRHILVNLISAIGSCLIKIQPELITIISLLAYAREEDDFKKYRKAILDACGLVERIKESDADA